MNDENHKKHPEVTAHPLPEGKTADTGECVHVTEPLIKTATPEEASTAIPGMDRTQTQTEEEREQEHEEKRKKEEDDEVKPPSPNRHAKTNSHSRPTLPCGRS